LLTKAKERLMGKGHVEVLPVDINQICLPEQSFDIILCVSALHHVVELEHVMAQISNALIEGGEFWSIGEYVGRNGTRLFDNAYRVANDYFRKIPEKYRINRNIPENPKVDDELPNYDCSITCFEGIRSEDIEPLIAKHFDPVAVIKFDCFLWRLFNLSYLDNYNMNKLEDIDIIEKAIQLEVAFLREGGRPTALWGVYRLKG